MRYFNKVLIASLLASTFGFAQSNVHQLADRIDRHYNDMQTLQTGFTELYRGAGISRTESGTLYLKRPGRMRWEYSQPRQKLFVTEGRTAWFYVPGEKQARKMPLKSLDDLRTPLAFLLGKTRLEKEFTGLSLAPDVAPSSPGNIVLRGVPRNMGGNLSQVLFEVTSSAQIQRILAYSVDGSTTEFRFTNQRENAPVSDAHFKFSPPHGVETIQTEELGQ